MLMMSTLEARPEPCKILEADRAASSRTCPPNSEIALARISILVLLFVYERSDALVWQKAGLWTSYEVCWDGQRVKPTLFWSLLLSPKSLWHLLSSLILASAGISNMALEPPLVWEDSLLEKMATLGQAVSLLCCPMLLSALGGAVGVISRNVPKEALAASGLRWKSR